MGGFINRHRDPLILLAVAAAALATRVPLLAHARPYGDEILYALFGDQWLQGILPYTLVWDVKPPGLFALYALTEAASGDAFLSVRLLPLLATLAAVVGIWRIGVAWFGNANVGLIAAILYCANSLAQFLRFQWSFRQVTPKLRTLNSTPSRSPIINRAQKPLASAF